LGTYIVDFYCPAFRLVVEIDGEIHRYQEVDDQARTDQLEEKGYKVIRFWNFEVEQNLDTVLDTIAENCDLPSPKAGRRACPERSEGAGDGAIPYDLGEFLVVANFLLRSASSPT
jgi:hypothetical protein